MDDEISIVRNDAIKSLANAPEILTSSFFGKQAYYRPLVSISYMIEYHLFGLKPLYYYLTNILIHIATSISLFFLLNFLFRRKMLAFGVALLFAIHPIHWEAVSNIPGRAILLCAFFYVNAFFLFCRSRKDKRTYIFSLAAFILALLSKESAAMLPLLLLSYQFFLGREKRGGGERWEKWILPVVPFFLVAGLYLLLRRYLGITHLFYWHSIKGALLGVMTFLRSVITYLRLFVIPVDLQFDRSRQLFSGLLNVEALGTLLFFAVMIILIVRFRRKLSATALFFMTWFGIELIPVSQIVASIGVQPGHISTAEHFLYTPSVGIFVLIGLAFQKLYQESLRGKIISLKYFKILMAGLYAFLFLMTVQANLYATNEIAMFERTLGLNPSNIRVRNSLALAFAKLNRFEEAEGHFREVLDTAPWDARARIGLGKALCDQGKFQEGIREYEKVRQPGDLRELLAENLRLTYNILISQYRETLEKDPNNREVRNALNRIRKKYHDQTH